MVEWCRRHGATISAYCLMPSQLPSPGLRRAARAPPRGAVGLIVAPPGEGVPARAVGEAHRHYTRRVSFREGRGLSLAGASDPETWDACWSTALVWIG